MQQRLSLSCFVILPLSSTMAASAHPPGGNRGQAHFDQRPMGSQVRDSGSLITRNVPIHDRASSESFLTYGAVLAPMLEAGYRMERFPSHMQVR